MQGRGRGALFVQPQIEQLFERPRGLGQARQADHAAATLQGMESAPDGGKLRHRARMCAARGEVFGDRGQHAVGLFEEDRQQLLVEYLVARLEQALRVRRGRLGGGRELRHGLRQGTFALDALGRVELRERIARVGSERGIRHELGIVLYFAQLASQPRLDLLVLRRLAQCLVQDLGIAPLLPQLLLHARGRGRLRRSNGPHRRGEVGLAVTQGVNVETEAREDLRHRLELLERGTRRRASERAYALGAALQRALRLLLAQQPERSRDLMNHGIQRRELSCAGGIAEIGIQRLLDPVQVRLHLRQSAAQRELFLCALHHCVDQIGTRQLASSLRIEHRHRQARQHDLDLPIEIGR